MAAPSRRWAARMPASSTSFLRAFMRGMGDGAKIGFAPSRRRAHMRLVVSGSIHTAALRRARPRRVRRMAA